MKSNRILCAMITVGMEEEFNILSKQDNEENGLWVR